MFAFLQSEVADTVRVAAENGASPGGEQGGNLFTELLHHVQDSHELELPLIGHVALPRFEPLHVAGLTVDLSITKHVVFLWFAAALLVVFVTIAARQNKRNRVPSGLGNLMEILVQFTPICPGRARETLDG